MQALLCCLMHVARVTPVTSWRKRQLVPWLLGYLARGRLPLGPMMDRHTSTPPLNWTAASQRPPQLVDLRRLCSACKGLRTACPRTAKPLFEAPLGGHRLNSEPVAPAASCRATGGSHAGAAALRGSSCWMPLLSRALKHAARHGHSSRHHVDAPPASRQAACFGPHAAFNAAPPVQLVQLTAGVHERHCTRGRDPLTVGNAGRERALPSVAEGTGRMHRIRCECPLSLVARPCRRSLLFSPAGHAQPVSRQPTIIQATAM